MAGSSRASSRSRRSTPRGSRARSTSAGSAGTRKRKFFDYPRSGYTGLHRWLPSWRFMLGSFLSGVFLVAGAVVAAYATIDVPKPGEDVQAQTTTVYYADGSTVLGTFAVQKREIVELDTLPEWVGNAVVAAEDRTFYDNKGVSLTGMARAFLNNVRGGDKQGGSTLTQQYVERYYVDKTTTDYVGKFREVLLAVKITNQESKPEILGRYLNTIYFGRDSYGIQAAAQSYFGVDAKDLTISQAAMLAAIIPSPNNWDPAVRPQQAQARWQIVIDRMLEDGHITKKQHDEAAFPETVEYVRSSKYEGPDGHLLKMVEDEMAGEAINISKEKLDRGGYKVVTTIQKPVQDQLLTSVGRLLKGELTDGETPPSPNLKIAVSSVDPATGGVVALYGGPDFLTDQINWATYGDGVQAGSTFKPFTLVAALQSGISLDKRYSGRSPMTLDGWGDSDTQVTNFGGTSYGTMDLVDATADSVNTVYAQLNLEVGADKTAAVANAAGVTTPVQDNPANVLGSATVHPLDMASAYATFAAQGVHHDAHVVAKVLNANGSVNYETDGNPERRFEQDVMADATYAMTQVVERGSGEPYIKPLGVPVAGKTGTSTGNISAWFVGYTPTLATSVALSQVGDDGRSWNSITPFGPSPWGGKLVEVTGASIPAHLWADYMGPVLQMEQFAKKRDFPPRADVGDKPTQRPTTTPSPTPTPTTAPTTEPTQDATAKVPYRLQGKTQGDATAALLAVGLEPVIVTKPSDDVAAGRVISVDPAAGTRLPVGSQVTLVVSSGPKPQPTKKPDPKPDPTPTQTPAPTEAPPAQEEEGGGDGGGA